VADRDRAARDSFSPGGRAGSRREFLIKAVAGGGTLVVGGIIVAGLPKLATSAPSPEQDVEVANFALSLEYLQAAFYEEASQQALSDELTQFVEVVQEHERVHVEYLLDLLGADASPKPTFDFGNALADSTALTAAAVTLEDLGVAAYNGQATNLTPDALAAAARIVSVDARHAAWIRAIVAKPPALRPIDPPKSRAEVTDSLEKTGFLRTA
jgi:hypothetical protein